jgi:uncharacterized membrane protein (DUF106 family)
MNKFLFTIAYACFVGYLGYGTAAHASDLATAQRNYQESQANWARIHAQEAEQQRQAMREQMQQMQQDQEKMKQMQERYNCIASGRSSC